MRITHWKAIIVLLMSFGSLSFRKLTYFKRVPAYRLATRSQSTQPVVKTIDVAQLQEILSGKVRADYQIVDVREPAELQTMALHDKDVINLPLSNMESWTESVVNGEVLDNRKPTICLCKKGLRGLKMANFLVSTANFEDVTNVEGGLDAYANQIDSTICS